MEGVKPFLLLIIGAVALTACSTSNQLPPLSSIQPGAVQQGTLANEALVREATSSLYQITGGRKEISRFVMQQPVGTPGKKAWREVWIYDPEVSKRYFVLTFEEDGRGAASYQIGSM